MTTERIKLFIPMDIDDDETEDKPILLEEHRPNAVKMTSRQAIGEISEIFGTAPLPEETIHVIVTATID
ncbi:hypothetical protein BX616_003908, partial [Lobosporangium transversale]